MRIRNFRRHLICRLLANGLAEHTALWREGTYTNQWFCYLLHHQIAADQDKNRTGVTQNRLNEQRLRTGSPNNDKQNLQSDLDSLNWSSSTATLQRDWTTESPYHKISLPQRSWTHINIRWHPRIEVKKGRFKTHAHSATFLKSKDS